LSTEQAAAYSEAVVMFSRAIELKPDYALAWYNRGVAHWGLGQLDKTVTDFCKSLNMGLADQLRCHNLALVYIELGKPDDAIAAYSKAIELNPNSVEIWTARGRFYAIQGQWKKAGVDYKKLTELNPNHAEAWLELACLLVLDSDTEGYRQVCRTVLERFSGSSDPNVLHIAARTCALAPKAVPDRGQAVELAKKAVAARPKFGWHLHTLALAHYRAGQLDRAVRRLKESMEVDPGWCHVLNWLPLAMAHYHLGHAEEAQQWLDKGVQWIDKTPRGPNGALPVGSWTDRLECFILRREAIAEAEAAYRKAIALKPDDHEAYTNLGAALRDQGKLAEAEAAFRKAIALKPDDPKASANLGAFLRHQANTLAGQGQWQRAAAEYARAVEWLPRDLLLWCEYASALLLAGDQEGYRRVCGEVVHRFDKATDPLTPALVARIASLAPGAADPARVVQWAEKGVVARPSEAWFLHNLAMAHYRAGQFDQAVRRLEQSLKLGWGAHVLNALLLAMAHQRLGHADEARRWMDTAVQWIDQAGMGLTREARFALPVPNWADRMELQLLRREAEELLSVKKQKD
jgi:tetratricopeptide (TPR) repeat protein